MAYSQTLVVILKSNNVDIGQKTFNLSPNAELCASWYIDAAQAKGNLRVNIGGIVEKDVPSCGVVVQQSIDWLLWVIVALFVIAVIGLLLYFLTRRRK
jgi:hypothetical protein